MHIIDVLLLVVSCLLVTLVVLQKTDEDAASAFTGEKSELFANKKARGFEVGIQYTTTILSIAFFVLAILASFFVQRFSI